MARCSIREEGLRAAALPGGVAAADAVALDAGPRAHERVGHVEQRVLRFCAVREQVLLGREYESSHGGVARVPEPWKVLEVRAARLSSTDENVVVQALEPVWKSNFGRPTPSTRCRPHNHTRVMTPCATARAATAAMSGNGGHQAR